jgi:hypothetical protein
MCNPNPQPSGRVAHVVHLGTNTPCLAPCLQASKAFAEDPDEAGGVTTMEDSAPAPPQDSKTSESTFAAKTADAEALQPRTLAEAKCSPDKPPEEPNKEPVTSEVHPIAQGLRQTGSLDIDDPKTLSALVPPLTDPAPASAAKCAITYDVLYREAINISSWTALATRPDITFPDVHGSMAADWRATPGHTSHIDDGAICWPSRRQEDVSSTTPENDHAAATHGGKEALHPCSPFSDDHPPIAFTRNRQYHPPDHAYRHAPHLNHSGLQPADNTVADAPNNTPTSTKGRHFIASLGLRAK